MVRSQEAPRYNWHECGGSLIVISLMFACSWCTNFVQEFFCCWCRSFVGAGLLLLCQLYLCRDACVLPKQWQTVPHLFLFRRGGWSSNCGVHRNFCPYGFLSTSAPFASVCKALKLESPLLTMLVQGPLAWALIVWRCSLVFSSIDKIVSVLIHLLPGDQGSFIKLCWIPAKMYVTHLFWRDGWTMCFIIAGIVFFIIRWWDPSTFSHHSPEDTGPWPAWPLMENDRSLWLWLFVVPLFAYSLWQMLYFLVVDVLRRQRLLRDPEVMTSFRSVLVHWTLPMHTRSLHSKAFC